MSKECIQQNINNGCMTLTGRGEVSVEPDMAVVRLGVQTTGDKLQDIQEENARLSQAVLLILRQLGVNEINTFQYQVDRLYDFQDGTRIDRGFSVRNILEFQTDQLDQLGYIIDSAVQNGANVVEFISFEISNLDYFYQEALNLAVENAIDKAKSVSSNLGYPMDPIPICITENGSVPIPFGQQFAMRDSLAVTPIEPGTKEIVAMVTVEFTLPYFADPTYPYSR